MILGKHVNLILCVNVGKYHQILLVRTTVHGRQQVLETVACFREEHLALAVLDKLLQIKTHLLRITIIMHRVGYIQTHLLAHTEIIEKEITEIRTLRFPYEQMHTQMNSLKAAGARIIRQDWEGSDCVIECEVKMSYGRL